MPDGGFFASEPSDYSQAFELSSIGINIAGDMLDRRFNDNFQPLDFLEELAKCLADLLDQNQNLSIYLVPHIWRDVKFISEFLPLIPDPYLRRRIIINELQPTVSGLGRFLESYKNFDLVYGMRFHANVCPIGMGVPSYGLSCYPQISHLYTELNIQDRLIDVRKSGFADDILNVANSDQSFLNDRRIESSKIALDLHRQACNTLDLINDWLNSIPLEVKS